LTKFVISYYSSKFLTKYLIRAICSLYKIRCHVIIDKNILDSQYIFDHDMQDYQMTRHIIPFVFLQDNTEA